MQLVSIIFMESEDCPSRKLDFSVPLLSTRRPATPRKRGGLILPAGAGENPVPLAVDVSNRVPFSWERIPGKPKETDDQAGSDDFPLPKPPPGRWYPGNGGSRSDCDCCEEGRHCDNYDGDVEDGGNREVQYSDALDVFSLGESSSSSDNNVGDNNDNNVGGDRTTCLAAGGNFEPDLIFLRFLKDAKALAADSLINGCDVNEAASDHHHRPDSCFARALSVGQRYEYSSCSKACGLDIFLPWRMKPKPCGGGVRNSVVAAAASPRLKPSQWGTRKPQDHV
nr:Ethylene-overproduction protein 1 [Ipomoea batatas]